MPLLLLLPLLLPQLLLLSPALGLIQGAPAAPCGCAAHGASQPWPRCPAVLASEPPPDGADEPSLYELVETRDFGALTQRARDDPSELLALAKEAGAAGAVSYTAVELTFFAIALPTGLLLWHGSTGEWLQPLLLLQSDDADAEGKFRLVGLLVSCERALRRGDRTRALLPSPQITLIQSHNMCHSHLCADVVLLKTLFPLRLGATLLLLPTAKRALDKLQSLRG